MEDYGPEGTIWVSPDGKVWRYKYSNTGYAHNSDGETLWDKPFKTHYFSTWDGHRSSGSGVFHLPPGTVKVWTPK